MGSVADHPAFEELIDPAEQLVRLGSGYEFTEGPVWSPLDGCLYFCDLPGDTRWRWSEDDGMQVALGPRSSPVASRWTPTATSSPVST